MFNLKFSSLLQKSKINKFAERNKVTNKYNYLFAKEYSYKDIENIIIGRA